MTRKQRHRMVNQQLRPRGITDPVVLEAMREVPRECFVPEENKQQAYQDRPLPIGRQQTISQPYIVARMTQQLNPQPGASVLEVGTGSGYQAAVLVACRMQVFTIERHEALARQATQNLEAAGYRSSITIGVGDGIRGWPEKQPFQRILWTASCPDVPHQLLQQLEIGGRAVEPVQKGQLERLYTYVRRAEGVEQQPGEAVRFVPLVEQGGPVRLLSQQTT